MEYDIFKFINYMMNKGTLPFISKRQLNSLWEIYVRIFPFSNGTDDIIKYYHDTLIDLWEWEMTNEYEELFQKNCLR